MALPKPFAKDVFIRLEGRDAFVSTVKYGCFYSKTKEFDVDWEPSPPALQDSERRLARYLVPPVTVLLKKRHGV